MTTIATTFRGRGVLPRWAGLPWTAVPMGMTLIWPGVALWTERCSTATSITGAGTQFCDVTTN